MSKAHATLKDGTDVPFNITLDEYCEMFELYRPGLRRGWDDTEYSLFKIAAAKKLGVDKVLDASLK